MEFVRIVDPDDRFFLDPKYYYSSEEDDFFSSLYKGDDRDTPIDTAAVSESKKLSCRELFYRAHNLDESDYVSKEEDFSYISSEDDELFSAQEKFKSEYCNGFSSPSECYSDEDFFYQNPGENCTMSELTPLTAMSSEQESEYCNGFFCSSKCCYSDASYFDENSTGTMSSEFTPLEYLYFTLQNQHLLSRDSGADTIPEDSTETKVDICLGEPLKLNSEWLNSCISELNMSVSGGVGNLNDAQKTKLIMQRFLLSDIRSSCGGGILPENVGTLHDVNLPGPFVLQVNEIVNISGHPLDRFEEVPSGITRCLKLSMTDGVRCVVGMEHWPIKDLQVLAPAGLKVIVENVNVRYGCLMLVPEGLKVVGGVVESLEAQRRNKLADFHRKRKWTAESCVGDFPIADNSTLLESVQGIIQLPNGSPNDSLSQSPRAFEKVDQMDQRLHCFSGIRSWVQGWVQRIRKVDQMEDNGRKEC